MRFATAVALCSLFGATAPLSGQSLRWTFATGGPLLASPTLHEGTVFIGSADGHLYAVNATTGTERWRFRTGGAVDATPTVHDGLVYVLSRDGGVHAVDVERGTARWSFRTRGEQQVDFWDHFLSDPLVHEDLVIFGSGDSTVYALDRRTGAPRWAFKTVGAQYFPRGDIQRAPAVVDGIAYFGSRDYNIYAVNTSTGTAHWNLREGLGWIIATPLVTDSLVYYGASDGQRFYASDRRTGRVRWSVPVRTRVFGSAVQAGDAILFGGFNGRLFALDPRDGSERWTWQVPTSRQRWHSVYDTDGAPTEEFRDLYRTGRGLEAEGRILELGSIAGTPAVDEGTVYVASADGTLYALTMP